MANIPGLNKVVPHKKPAAPNPRVEPISSPVSVNERHRVTSASNPTQRSLRESESLAARDFIKKAGRWLVDIPISVLGEHSAWTSTGNWQGIFDCAIWLRTPAGLPHPIQLVLKYIDNSGEKIIQIDRCQTGSHRTVLLNGSITLAVNGRVREMGLYLIGASDITLTLEEWHMNPQQRRNR